MLNSIKYKGVYIILFVFLFYSTPFLAQSPNNTLGNWAMGFNQTRLNEKWSLHNEVQYRSYEVRPNTEQLLLRFGVNYHINNKYSFTIGYGSISNFAFDKDINPDKISHENRFWQQFIMKDNLGRFYFEHRYRFEQRWIESSTNSKYLDRVRYLLRVSVPINNKEIVKNTLFASFYDEIFINVTSNPFDRNRLYAGLGYQFNKSINTQIGYLIQTVNSTTKNYLQLSLNYNLDFRKTNP